MSGRQYHIDEDVFAELQRRAEPLVDDLNSVLRRLLGLTSPDADDSGAARSTPPPAQTSSTRSGPRVKASNASKGTKRPRPSAPRKSAAKSKRAPRGSLLPQQDYEDPLLRSLMELGGRAPTSEVVERTGAYLHDKLTPADREVLDSGDVRWKNRVQFVRLGLIKEGLIAKDSPRGIWEITAAGQARATEAERSSNDR